VATYNYPNTSGVIDISPSALSGLGITIGAGDTLNIQAGTYPSMKATGLNGSAGNFITVNFLSGAHFDLLSYTFDNELVNCSFVKFIAIDVLHCTHAIFHSIWGASHDLYWQNCNFRNITDQNCIQIGSTDHRKNFDGTKAKTFYNFTFDTCLFDGSTLYGTFVSQYDGISLDMEVKNCTFRNITQPADVAYPIALDIHCYGAKIHGNTFHGIGNFGHMQCIHLTGYGDVYQNMFYDNYANDVRCWPLTLNLSGYTAGENRFYNNISHDKRKYSMFEINTNQQNSLETDGTGFFRYNPNNFVYFNTLVRSIAELFQANIVDFYGADGTAKGNLIIQPETDNTYNPAHNYRVYNQAGTYHTSAVTQSNNYQRQFSVPADFDESSWSPVGGGTLLDNMSEDISYITTDFYGNPRKHGSASDAGAVEYQGVVVTPNVPPVANAGSDITFQLPDNTTSLNGSGSHDTDGTISTYAWAKVSGPAGGAISNPSSAITDVTGLQEGAYVYRLTVTDDEGDSDTDDVTVTVQAAPVSVPNIFADRPNIVVALETISFVDAGITADNMAIIYMVDTPIKSFIPGRAINGISEFEEGQGYYVIPLQDLDLSAFLAPPIPDINLTTSLLLEDGLSLTTEDDQVLILE
jgi:hypothetical protein